MQIDDYVLEALLEQIRFAAESQGKGVVDILVEKGIVTEAQVVGAKAAQFGAECAEDHELDNLEPVIAKLPTMLSPRFLKASRMVPIAISAKKIIFATSDPSDLDSIDTVCYLVGNRDIGIKVASERAIKAALVKYFFLTEAEYAESLKRSAKLIDRRKRGIFDPMLEEIGE